MVMFLYNIFKLQKEPYEIESRDCGMSSAEFIINLLSCIFNTHILRSTPGRVEK